MNKYHKLAIEYYKHFHQYPELSKQEYKTTKFIIDKLNEIGGYVLDTRTDTGVVATLNHDKKECIAFRADMDALPIHEETNLEYASKIDGVMHACGHDFHTANLLALAHLLKDLDLDIKIKLVFQPNEETTPGSSIDFINNGVFDDVSHIFGLHVENKYPTKTIAIKKGALYASIDDFYVKVIGEGGHISTPHLAKDPLYCATSIVSEIKNAISNRIDPINPPLIGISTFNYGNGSNNIINDEVYFCGTIRTLNSETRTKSIEYLELLIKNYTKAYDLKYEIDWAFGEPPLINDIELTTTLQNHLSKLGNANYLEINEPMFGGEDFSNYAMLKPSTFFLIGCHTNDYDLHNSKFEIDLEAFKYSLTLFKDIALYFNKSTK